jgi:hypothetical protein
MSYDRLLFSRGELPADRVIISLKEGSVVSISESRSWDIVYVGCVSQASKLAVFVRLDSEHYPALL